ncbi:MAG: hypothetical protein ABIP81_00005 [Terriglobales bacterium]
MQRFARSLTILGTIFLGSVLGSALLIAQESAPTQPAAVAAPAPTPTTPVAAESMRDEKAQETIVTLPPGTKVLLMMKNAVSSRNARPGDGVYLETSFPVVVDGRVVIPAGTFVQGVVDSVKRSGRIKGRAEILLHFTTLIYPNGYTVSIPATLESADSADTQKVKDKEGTVQAEGQKGRDAAKIATASGTGGLIGGLSTRSLAGAAIGGGIGSAVGLIETLFTRGDEVRLENGSAVEMVLNRPVELDANRIDSTSRSPQPTMRRGNRMEKQVLTPSPTIGGIPR